MYKINKQKCTGCQICVRSCPGATKIGTDGKAEVISQEKLEQCGGENLCPMGAIEKDGSFSYQSPLSKGKGLGKGRGPGRAKGMGRKRRGVRG